MRRLLTSIVVAAAIAELSACGGGSTGSSVAPPVVTPAPSANGSPYDAVIQQNYAGGWGVELAVYKNGAPLYVHGYGFRDRGLPDSFAFADMWKVPQPEALYNLTRGQFAPDANTIFDLASVSKEFTAGAILLLQQDGKLSVNDPLSKYFPGFPNGNAIVLQHLLQHSSGLVDYNNFGGDPDFTAAYNAFMASGQTNYQPIVDRLATYPLLFTPGSQFSYSNTNYVLLGMIVAQLSGQSLGAFLQQRIFGPLGMTQTNQGNPNPPVTDIALGYLTNGGTAERAWQWNLSWLAGPGGLTSTVGDIEKWDRAVRQPGIFTQASLAGMFAPSPFPQSYGTPAAGWFISSLSGHLYIWHDGEIGGFQTMNATFPNDGIDIIVLTNDGINGFAPYSVIAQLFPLALSGTTQSTRRSTR